MLEAASLVNDLAADGGPVELKPKDNFTAAVKHGVTDQLGQQELQTAEPLRLEQPVEVPGHSAAGDGGRGRVVGEGEVDGDGHGSPCGRRAGTGDGRRS